MSIKSNGYFVTGIGTEVGKTVISSILVKALEAEYWKPVQAGDLDKSDSMKIESWASHPKLVIHPEQFRLNTPASPHYAAAVDGVEIQLDAFQQPVSKEMLIVEGAGGLLVPLNSKDTMLDLMEFLGLPVILISRNYLGSINHSLLSIEAIKRRKLPFAGIIFNGPENKATESIIEKHAGDIPVLARIPDLEQLDAVHIAAAVSKIASQIRGSLVD